MTLDQLVFTPDQAVLAVALCGIALCVLAVVAIRATACRTDRRIGVDDE